MKKKVLKVLGIIVGIILLIILGIVIKLNSYSIIINESTLSNEPKDIFKLDEERTIYSTFEDIKIKKWGKEYTLQEAFENKKISLFELMVRANSYTAKNDGGTIILLYKKGGFTNTDFSIALCKAKQMDYDKIYINKNIYIIKDYDGICHRNEENEKED